MFRQLIITFIAFGTLNAEHTISLVDQSDCPRICPDNYDPICGSDGSTFEEFANACELQLSNCLLMEDKEPFAATDLDWCRTEKIESWDSLLLKLGNVFEYQTECSKICSKIYKPICISNGQFRVLASNDCLMDNLNCALGNQVVFKILKNDSC